MSTPAAHPLASFTAALRAALTRGPRARWSPTLAAALLAGLILQPAAPTPRPARAGDDLQPLISYGRLAQDPEAWVGQPVRLKIQFQALFEDWNPYLTRFGTQDFVGLTAWSDEQRVWRKADYERPAVRLFLPRDGSALQRLQGARPHERFEVTCLVREMFGGEPWVEVLKVQRLAQEVPEGTVLHAIRGMEFMRKRAWALAASQFDRALAAPLPDGPREELLELQDICTRQRDSTENRVHRARFEMPRRPAGGAAGGAAGGD